METTPINASFTMQDENIKRIDAFLTEMDKHFFEVISGKGENIRPTIYCAQLVFKNVKFNLNKVRPELTKKIENLLNELSFITRKSLNKIPDQQKLLEDIDLLTDHIHQSTDEIGIGIRVRAKHG